MKQIDLREGARRQHRSVALFAVVQCWLRSLDGLAFERRHLERLIGLKRFKQSRVDWLQQDFKDFFPHQKVYKYRKKANSFASMVIARKPFDKFLPLGTMTTRRRLKGMRKGGPRIGMFQLWDIPDADLEEAFEGLAPFFADRVNFDERFLSSFLSLVAQGQVSPKSLLLKDEP